MAEKIDSLSGTPQQPAVEEHLQLPPIGPTPGTQDDVAAPAAPPTPTQPTPLPSAESLLGIADHPQIETHTGPLPIRPVPGVVPKVAETKPKPLGTPLAQRSAYLWLLLLVGVIFLVLLAVVYLGGIYRQ